MALPPETQLKLDPVQAAIIHNFRWHVTTELAEWDFDIENPAKSLKHRDSLRGQLFILQTILEHGVPGYSRDFAVTEDTEQD